MPDNDRIRLKKRLQQYAEKITAFDNVDMLPITISICTRDRQSREAEYAGVEEKSAVISLRGIGLWEKRRK